MAIKELEIIQPTFYRQFSCIGPACTDNCCHDWIITIDKQHYLQYKAVQDPKFREICSHAVKRNKNKNGTHDFGIMHLHAGERCAFQDEDGGCGIYRLLGPDALSDTCTFYPRVKKEFLPGIWELSLSLSCIEAARLALFSGKPLELERIRRPYDPSSRSDRFMMGQPRQNSESITLLNRLQTVRQACLDLIQLNTIPLPDRILAIGLLLRAADKLMVDKKAEQLLHLAGQYVQQAAEGKFSDVLGQMAYSKDTHLWALVLPASHLMQAERRGDFLQMWKTLEPLCDGENGRYVVGPRALEFILEQAQKKGDPLLQRHALAVENYFANYIFSSLFPFTYFSENPITMEYHGVILAEQYMLLRILLSLLPEVEGQSEQQRLLRAVVALARITQHTNLAQAVNTFGREKPEKTLDTLAHAAYLLR